MEIREAQKVHDKDEALQGEIAITGGPPETKRVSAREAFYRPIEDLIKVTTGGVSGPDAGKDVGQ